MILLVGTVGAVDTTSGDVKVLAVNNLSRSNSSSFSSLRNSIGKGRKDGRATVFSKVEPPSVPRETNR